MICTGRKGEGKARGGDKGGAGTGLCEEEPKNIMARQKMIFSMYVGDRVSDLYAGAFFKKGLITSEAMRGLAPSSHESNFFFMYNVLF